MGLILLILFSFKKWNIPILLKNKNGSGGILRGSFLTVFAYIGFQSLVKLNRETINYKKNIPLGIISSIVISTIIYILVSIASISVMGIDKISKSNTPISDSINNILGENFKKGVDIIALISITSSILLAILYSSRQLQSISSQNIIPNYFKDVNTKTHTPIKAILFISVCAIIVSQLQNLELTTTISNTFIFIIFTLVNLSSIIINYKETKNIPIYSFRSLATTIMICISISNNYFNNKLIFKNNFYI